jgi:hypothetical protein
MTGGNKRPKVWDITELTTLRGTMNAGETSKQQLDQTMDESLEVRVEAERE